MLGFVDEIMLLQLDAAGGRAVDPPSSVTQIVLSGAALMELALRDRVDADIERLFVVDPTPTGDDILDDVVRHLAGAGTELSAAAAIRWIASQAKDYQWRALERLVANGSFAKWTDASCWHAATRPIGPPTTVSGAR